MSEIASLPNRHRTVEGLLEHLVSSAPRLKGLLAIPIWEGEEAPYLSLWFTPLTMAEASLAATVVQGHAIACLTSVQEETVEGYTGEEGA